jgi:hypothetical protein
MGEHESYDYQFHEVAVGKNYQGTLQVSSEKYQKARGWFITIGLAYVLDKTGIDRKRAPREDPILLLGELNNRATRIQLGWLEVAVQK